MSAPRHPRFALDASLAHPVRFSLVAALATKSFVGKRPRTTLSLTTDGLGRWREHLDALRRIADPQDP